VASNFGSKIDSTPKQTKSFKFSQKFTHLDSWVVTLSLLLGIVSRLATGGVW
jgi:hypothetical protein